jgi:hypothetical protein
MSERRRIEGRGCELFCSTEKSFRLELFLAQHMIHLTMVNVGERRD